MSVPRCRKLKHETQVPQVLSGCYCLQPLKLVACQCILVLPDLCSQEQRCLFLVCSALKLTLRVALPFPIFASWSSCGEHSIFKLFEEFLKHANFVDTEIHCSFIQKTISISSVPHIHTFLVLLPQQLFRNLN